VSTTLAAASKLGARCRVKCRIEERLFQEGIDAIMDRWADTLRIL
jgi:hypothetical protein